jgi:nitrate/nitrite transport system permease protein
MTAIAQPDATTTPPEVPESAPAAPPVAGGRLASILSSAGWALVGAVGLVLLWAFAASRSDALPTPSEAFSALRHLLAHPFSASSTQGRGIGLQLLSSLGRVFKGFALAVLVGVPVGLAMGSSTRVWKSINPIVQLLRPVSPLAWFPIWLKITQSGPKAAVWVIFITALWLVVINTAAGAANIPHEQLDVSRVFKFGRLAYIRYVLIPNALPSIVTGLRSAMGIAWMVIVAVEMMSGSSGIGFFVWDAYNAGRLDNVIAAIVLIGAVGLILDSLFLRLARRVTLEVRR